MKKTKYPVGDPRNVKEKWKRMIPEIVFMAWVVGTIIYAIFWIVGKF